MFESISRRGFLGLAPVMPLVLHGQSAPVPPASTPSSDFPQQPAELVREAVGVSHNNLARLKELVSARPALARASWDWGYGDWETAIDAASHVGNRPIADYLIANGARPTIYTAAMIGQLGIVKGWVEAIPGVQRNRGPHGITLLAHARAGGPGAADVVKYLEALGDADPRYTDLPITEVDPAALAGEYAFGPGATERLKVARNARGVLTVTRPGYSERGLAHQGSLAFIPVGAEAVRIRFDVADGKARALIVEDGPFVLRAQRAAAP
jgi:hypothetical protein